MFTSLEPYVALAYAAVLATWAVRAHRRRGEGGWIHFLVRSVVLAASVWAATGAWLHVSVTQLGSTLSLLNIWSLLLGVASLAVLGGLTLGSVAARIGTPRVEHPPAP